MQLEAFVREPAVAGRFYPGDPERLAASLEELLPAQRSRRVRALIAPHAGYMYSGRIAGETFARVDVPERVIVLCPNHTGSGARRSVWRCGEWLLPGGAVKVDEQLAATLITELELDDDRFAHLGEHAAEVLLPFLRARCHPLQIVPICLSHLEEQECVALGQGIARIVARAAEPILIVASSDMSHYVPEKRAEHMDHLALEQVMAVDARGLHRVVEDKRISMCGYVPTAVALAAARALGAERGELVRYGTSGDVTGDRDSVVGYAGVLVP